jgi:galactose-1-phosphate uridylyltransferase
LLGEEKPRRNYKRVINEDVYTHTPEPPVVAYSIEVPYVGVKIASKLQSYMHERIDEILEELKQEIKEDLEDHKGFIKDVSARETKIKQEINEVVDEDEIIHAIKDVVDDAGGKHGMRW